MTDEFFPERVNVRLDRLENHRDAQQDRMMDLLNRYDRLIARIRDLEQHNGWNDKRRHMAEQFEKVKAGNPMAYLHGDPVYENTSNMQAEAAKLQAQSRMAEQWNHVAVGYRQDADGVMRPFKEQQMQHHSGSGKIIDEF